MKDLTIDLDDFFSAHDLSPHTVAAIRLDVQRFVRWFTDTNGERWDPKRVSVIDVAHHRDHLRTVENLSVSTVNRALFSIRKYLGHLVSTGVVETNPAKQVRELRRSPTAPKGLSRSEVRKLMREVELRGDHRAGAVFGTMLYAGLRVSEVVGLGLDDVSLAPRSGSLTVRSGKGRKQRQVGLPAEGRRLIGEYMEVRPPVGSARLFIGERGPLTAQGVRSLCYRYSAVTGIRLHPHLMRHTFGKKAMAETGDLALVAMLMGHENVNTTAIYLKPTQDDVQQRVEELRYA